MFRSGANTAARVFACLFVAPLLFSLATITQGQTTINWNNPAGGSYHTAANWNPANVPNTATETARFNLNAAVTISFNAGSNTTIDDLQILGGGDVTFRNAGLVNDATLTISDDAILSLGHLTLTRLPGGTADVNLVIAGLLDVGDGELTILNSARVQSSGGGVGDDINSPATVTVSGAGSTWTNIGNLLVGLNNGTGTLRIEEGGSVSNGEGTIGFSSLSTGNSVTVSGTDGNGNASTWTNIGQLRVGDSGMGTLTIEDGGIVSNTSAIIGRNSISTATVTGGGSTWANSSFLTVGELNSGSGTLTIEAGGSVSNTSAHIGSGAGSTGQATVSGAGSTWTNTGDLSVGVSGTGTLNVLDGGLVVAANINIHTTNGTLNWDTQGTLRVNGGTITGLHDANNDVSIGSGGGQKMELIDGASLSTNNARVGNLAGSSGSIAVSGAESTWVNTSGFYVGEFGTGTLTIEAGGGVSTGGSFIGSQADSTGDVTVTGAGSTWTNNGTLRVGQSGAGTLTIEAGGSVFSNLGGVGETIIGAAPTSTGTANISGTDGNGNASTWNIDAELWVANVGSGTLMIEAGASVSNTIGVISRSVGSTGTATVRGTDGDGNASTWVNSGELRVGRSSSGTLMIEAGGSVSNTNGIIGCTITAPSEIMAAVTVRGTDGNGNASTWVNSGELRVGQSGAGTLTIEAGGSVTNTNGFIGFSAGASFRSGAATVSGTDGNGNASTWANSGELRVGAGSFGGSFATGSLTIAAGGRVSNTIGTIGFATESSGTVTVTGDDGNGIASTWSNSSSLTIGSNGKGTLTIAAGGRVLNTIGTIANSASSSGTVTVDGAGSIWENSSDLVVGNSGSATLELIGGGEVVVHGSLLANASSRIRLAGGKLSVNQFGAGALDALDWRSGTLHLTSSDGLTIGNGGLFGSSLALDQNKMIEVDNLLIIEDSATLFAARGLKTGSAVVQPTAWLFAIDGAIDFGAGLTNHGNVVLSSTTVEGPVTNAAGAAITALGDVTFNDLVDGPGGFFGAGAITFSGGMAPGASPAEVSFESDVTLGSNNTLWIELGGITKGTQYDSLNVAGGASLDGALNVSFLDNFVPSNGDTFQILTSTGGISGTFASAILPTLSGDLFWNVNYGSNSVLLVVTAPELLGDYNDDGAVDAADYVVWRKNGGTQPAYDTWRANFGRTAALGATTGPASSAAVPEPAAALLLLMAGLIGVAAKCGRERHV